MFIKKRVGELIIQKKSMGVLFWFPLVANFIIIPLVCALTLMNGNTDDFSSVLSTCSQVIGGFFSTWWAIFSCSEYVEGEGAELLTLYRSNIVGLIGGWTVIYLVVLTIPFLLYYCIDNIVIYELAKACLIVILLNGIAFIAMALSRSTGVSLVCVIAYMTVSILYQSEYLEVFLFFSKQAFSLEEVWESCRYLILIALFCWVTGAILSRRSVVLAQMNSPRHEGQKKAKG